MPTIVGQRKIKIREGSEEEISLSYEDTSDVLFEVEKTYKEAEEDLIKFVERQVELMNENLLFAGASIPGFYELNKSLMDFESIALGLLTLHQNCRIEMQIAQENYDNFYSEKFVEIKMEQVNLGKQAQFTAARDIELCVRQRYMKELAKMKADIIKTENKYNFVNHLMTSWDKYSFILNTLSANARAEATASGVASKNPKEMGDEI